MEKEIEINGKKFVVHELLAVEEDEIFDMELDKPSLRLKERLKKSTGITDEEYSKLTSRERDKILKVMNELNGWGAFQKSETEDIKD